MCVGDNRLFKVGVSDQERTVIQFVHELIQLLGGYLPLSNALTTSPCELKQTNSRFRFRCLIHFVSFWVVCVCVLLSS